MNLRTAAWLLAGIAAATAALGGAASAAPALPGGPAAALVDKPPMWASLTNAQQAALAPLQRDWAGIDAARKQKWIELASRFRTMPPAERERVQERMAAWARMTPAERGLARLQFQESRQFTPADRQARWEAYQALPDDERRALVQQAKPTSKAASAPVTTASGGTARTADASAGTTAAGAQKRNMLPPLHETAVKSVAPTLVQAKPGATTSLMSAKPAPVGHQQPGMPKIAATEGFVNRNTLLPKRGAQGAAAVEASGTAATVDKP